MKPEEIDAAMKRAERNLKNCRRGDGHDDGCDEPNHKICKALLTLHAELEAAKQRAETAESRAASTLANALTKELEAAKKESENTRRTLALCNEDLSKRIEVVNRLSKEKAELETVRKAAQDYMDQLANTGAHKCVGYDCAICRCGAFGDLEQALADTWKEGE